MDSQRRGRKQKWFESEKGSSLERKKKLGWVSSVWIETVTRPILATRCASDTFLALRTDGWTHPLLEKRWYTSTASVSLARNWASIRAHDWIWGSKHMSERASAWLGKRSEWTGTLEPWDIWHTIPRGESIWVSKSARADKICVASKL